jgi:hypothetical protein
MNVSDTAQRCEANRNITKRRKEDVGVQQLAAEHLAFGLNHRSFFLELGTIFMLMIVVYLIGCSQDPKEDKQNLAYVIDDGNVTSYPSLQNLSQAPLWFEEVTNQVGIDYIGTSNGVAWGDFNGDGLPDIWKSGHAPLTLYINRGNGTFENVAMTTVVAGNADRHGAAWADADNDGDQDLIQLNGAGRGRGVGENNLFINSQGKLVAVGVEAGISNPTGRGRTPLWLDFDNDGLLDILVNNAYREEASTVLFRQDSNRFISVSSIPGLADPIGSEFALLGYLTNDQTLNVLLGMPFPSKVYTISDGEFIDSTKSWNIPNRSVTDAVLFDFDNDQRPDLFTVRGALEPGVSIWGENRVLFRLRADSSVEELHLKTAGDITVTVGPVAKDWWRTENIYIGSLGIHPEEIPFTLSASDVDVHEVSDFALDQDKGISIGYDAAKGIWRVLLSASNWEQVNGVISSTSPITQLTYKPSWNIRQIAKRIIDKISSILSLGFRRFYPPFEPRLYLNKEMGFIDSSERIDLSNNINCFSIGAGDFDNDMDVDLYLVCGLGLTNAENVLLENLGNAIFKPLIGAGGAGGSLEGIGDAVAVADYDSDGFLDLFVTNGREIDPVPGGPSQLFHNLGNSNHWIEIDLVGTVSNRDGIGARVLLTAGGQIQLRSQYNGIHDRAQNHKRLHFGLGRFESIDLIEVYWPSGIVQELRNIDADQIVKIVEADG